MKIGFDAFGVILIEIIFSSIAIPLCFLQKKIACFIGVVRLAFEIDSHFLVPKHVLLSKKDIEEFLQKTGFRLEEMPQILASDPAIKNLKAEQGDVIKIIRISQTAGKIVYYRRVVD